MRQGQLPVQGLAEQHILPDPAQGDEPTLDRMVVQLARLPGAAATFCLGQGGDIPIQRSRADTELALAAMVRAKQAVLALDAGAAELVPHPAGSIKRPSGEFAIDMHDTSTVAYERLVGNSCSFQNTVAIMGTKKEIPP